MWGTYPTDMDFHMPVGMKIVLILWIKTKMILPKYPSFSSPLCIVYATLCFSLPFPCSLSILHSAHWCIEGLCSYLFACYNKVKKLKSKVEIDSKVTKISPSPLPLSLLCLLPG